MTGDPTTPTRERLDQEDTPHTREQGPSSPTIFDKQRASKRHKDAHTLPPPFDLRGKEAPRPSERFAQMLDSFLAIYDNNAVECDAPQRPGNRTMQDVIEDEEAGTGQLVAAIETEKRKRNADAMAIFEAPETST
ncbi:hypothetical protein EKO27_g7168 [Xylaria grammica]|uniref:Uncharacterized protein n=1 Tax=Xylaria grammica TaxID=363999 RepID=A0A439D0E6_9PEZI|nr:hypothetical protein EKO27_g7168 [Xylaria grammica]